MGRPDVVLFSRIVDSPVTRAERMTALEGLNEIIRSSPYVLFSHPPAKAHLEALKSAVQGAKCYWLYLGRDVLDDPVRAVGDVIKSIA